MKLKLVFGVAIFVPALALFGFQKNTDKEPWTASQLMAPADLAGKLNREETADLYIFNIGPSGSIKKSSKIGATQEDGNLALLKQKLTKLPKTSEVVIYCGCCPFEHCPNIRPAFDLLKEMKFVNAKLLNLPKNLKVDWIDKGYPLNK